MLKYGLILAAILLVCYFVFYKKDIAAPEKEMACKKKILDKNGNAIMVACDTNFIREINVANLGNVRPAQDFILTHELSGMQSSGFTKYQ